MAPPTSATGFRVTWQMVGGLVGLITLLAVAIAPIRTQDRLAMSVDNLTRTVEKLETTVTTASTEARSLDRVVVEQAVKIQNLEARVSTLERGRSGG